MSSRRSDVPYPSAPDGDQTIGLSLAAYAAAKGLSEAFLRQCGVRDDLYYGRPAVGFEYRTAADAIAFVRHRISLSGDRFRQPPGVQLIPYGLGKSMTEGNPASIVLGEGETDTLTCWLHDIPALGIPGASTWQHAWAGYIDALIVYVIQEPDDGGHTFVECLARSPLAPKIRVVHLPGAKDVNEFYLLDASTFRERFAAALASAEPLPEQEQSRNDEPIGIVLRRAADVRPAKASFAWSERIPLGSLSLLVGQPGLGKTLLAIELAARASRGQLDGDLAVPVDVLYLTAEDSPAHTLVPRLMAAGADLNRVSFLNVRDDVGERGLALPDDVDKLADAIGRAGARIVVIDPVMAHLATALDSHRDHAIRRALAPLARLADELGVAIAGVAHLNKSTSTDLFGRIGGSIGLTAAARSVLILAADPEAGEGSRERIVAHGKSNLSALAPALRLRIEGRIVDGPEGSIDTAGIAWIGEAPNVSVAELLGAATDARAELGPRREAETFLRELLAEGGMPSVAVQKAARNAGIAWATVRRAKAALRIRARKVGQPGADDEHWEWTLPVEGAHEGAEDAEGAHVAGESTFGDSEHLRGDQPNGQDGYAPAPRGALCSVCNSGPFISQEWYERHWEANHDYPASASLVQ